MSQISKTALVTGSSNGIGEAVAKLLAKLDYKLIVTGRCQTDVHRVAFECSKLSPSGHKPLEIVADLAHDEAVKSLAQQTEKHFNKSLNLLVNNAGFAILQALDKVDESMTAQREIFQVNFDSPVRLTLQLAESLRKGARDSGESSSIVNIGSIAGHRTTQCPFSYSCSKAALSMFTKCMASDLAPLIRVNCVSPGPIETKIVERSGMSLDIFTQAAKYLAVLERHGLPDEVAQVVAFLADSKRSSYVTGTDIMVDGGVGVKPTIWQP